jgi:hypothetical protein
MTPRWHEADEAVESLVATLVAEAARTADRSVRKRPRGRTRSKRRPKSTLRHIAEVVRAHRLAPGLRVDRNMVAALFMGHRDLVTNPVLVVGVAQACGIIAGRKVTAKKVARLRAASNRVAKLIARAEADTRLVPAPRTEADMRPVPARQAEADTRPVLAPPVPAPRAETGPPPVPAQRAETAPAPRAETATPPVPPFVEVGPRPSAGLAPPDRTPVVADRRRSRHARRWWLAAAVLLLLAVIALLAFG